MVDLATLDLVIDSTDVDTGVKKLDSLTAAGAKAEGAVDRLGTSMVETGRSTKSASAAAADFTQRAVRMTAAVNSNRQATSQLSIQFGDFLTQVSSGGNPLTAFGQQLNQITQVMALTSKATTGFAGFLAGPWGAAVSFAVLALAPFVSRLFEAEDATDSLREAEKRLVDSKQSLLESRYELDQALGRNTISYAEVKRAALDTALAELRSAQAAVNASQIRLQTARKERTAMDVLSGIGQTGPAGLGLISQLGGVLGYGDVKDATNKVKSDVSALNEGTASVNKAIAALLNAYKGPKVSGGGSGASGRAASFNAPRIEGLSEEARALETATKASEAYAAALNKEAGNIGKTSLEIKQMEIAAAAALAPTEELRRAIVQAGLQWELATSIAANADFQRTIIKPIEDELALLGLVGPARDIAALSLEKEAFTAKYGADAWEQYYQAKLKGLTASAALEAEKQAVDDLANSFRDLISALDGLGGIGRSLGNIGAIVAGLQSGDFSGVTGKVGSVLNILNSTKSGKEGFKLLGDKLDSIFGGTGSFTGTMKTILEGAGLGIAVGTSVFGNSKGSQVGGAIGGALGQVAGQAIGKAVGGALGSALGPIGSVLGSLFGSGLGSLLGSTPRASATITTTGVTATGSSSKLKAAASSAGNSVLDALAQLAEQLGGELGGAISLSIGTRNGSIRVDPTGRGITKTSKGAIDFGEDQAAAIKFAIADAIKDGVITGISAGAQALLRAGTDIEKQLNKALKFENVFKELKQRTDPLGFALEELGNEFTALKAIFAEAGATTAEYADLEKLFQLKREDALKQANSEAESLLRDRRTMEIRIMELQGNAAGALAAARELEISALDASLRPLQRIIYQMEDLRETADKFTGLAKGLREYRDTLFATDVLTGNAYATARSKFAATAALAGAGNADALGSLEGVSKDFLDKSLANASSFQQYQRDVAAVAGAVDKGIFAAESTADYAQLQLDALSNSVSLLTNIDTNIATLVAPQVEPLTVQPVSGGPIGATDAGGPLIVEIQAMREDMAALAAQGTANALTNAAISRLFTRWDGDGLLIRTDADTPIQVETI